MEMHELNLAEQQIVLPPALATDSSETALAVTRYQTGTMWCHQSPNHKSQMPWICPKQKSGQRDVEIIVCYWPHSTSTNDWFVFEGQIRWVLYWDRFCFGKHIRHHIVHNTNQTNKFWNNLLLRTHDKIMGGATSLRTHTWSTILSNHPVLATPSTIHTWCWLVPNA